MEAIFEFIQAETSSKAFDWFNELAGTVYSLEQFPERGTYVPENKKLRQLVFGRKPDTYRIIYSVDKRLGAVSILHIRHSARATLTKH
jgi:plasmid stabilization system protein ParE